MPSLRDSSELEDYDDNIFNNSNNITRNNLNCCSFADFGFNDILLQNIKHAQFENPSPVQSMAIGKMLLNENVLVQAKSGTGKTAVFVLSSIETKYREKIMMKNNSSNSNNLNNLILVLTHTKELALQIFQEYTRFTNNLNITTKILKYNSKYRVDLSNTDIIIGDIDTVLSFLSNNPNNHITSLIVDECDSIINDIKFTKIFNALARNLQNMSMFTATLTEKDKKKIKEVFVDKLQKNSLEEIYVDDDTQLTLYGLKQYYVECTNSSKISTVEEILKSINYKKCIIFCNKVQNVEYLRELLIDNNKLTNEIFSITQYDKFSLRLLSLNQFKNNLKNNAILITNDILSRGIDINDIELVINYDLPLNPQTYLHRVGRAGRFETEGVAVNLVATVKDRIRIREVMERYEVEINKLKNKY